MSTILTRPDGTRKASELRKLSAEERDAILAAAAALAEEDSQILSVDTLGSAGRG